MGLGGGISAPSFYAAFGSKEALFREAAQCYLDTYARVTECLWDDGQAPRQAIELALRQSAVMQSEPGHPPGCMVALGCMSAPTPEHAAVAAPLTASRARTRAGFARCVERGWPAANWRRARMGPRWLPPSTAFYRACPSRPATVRLRRV
jgi:AcrR family transcriptional regulator